MTHAIAAAAAVVVASAGVLLAAGVLVVSRRLTVALPVLLDMLMAAGLLRLGAGAAWSAIATAAATVLLRKLVVSDIHQTSVAMPPDTGP
jgi:hypothetical protein